MMGAVLAIGLSSYAVAMEAVQAERLIINTVRPISGTKILPGTVLAPDSSSGVVQIVASRGEYEPASVVLRAGARSIPDITVDVGDLIHLGTGARIAASNIDIRIVKVWFQGKSAWNDISKSRPDDFRQTLVPELLLRDDSLVEVDRLAGTNRVRLFRRKHWQYEIVNQERLAVTDQVLPTAAEFPVRDTTELRPFSIPAESSKQLWFTVRVPEKAISGNYHTEMTLRSGGIEVGNIRLDLRVTSFVLTQSKITYSVYYRAQLDEVRASIGSEYRNRDQMLAELKDMVAHGISNPTVYQDFADRIGLEAVLKLRQEAGILPSNLYYLGVQTTDSYLGRPQSIAESRISQIMPPLLRLTARYGYEQVYVYGKDEAKGDELTAQLDLWRIVHQGGGRVFVAGYADAYTRVGNVLDVLVSYGQPDPRQARLWHTGHKKIFNYQNPQSGPENPLLFRLNYGLLLWASDYDGAMIYAYQHCFGACWNDIDHPVYRDHNLTYPTVDGVIPTMAWEGLREAVDDVRYVTTLESAIDHNPDKDAAPVVAATVYLLKLKGMLQNMQGRAGKYNRDTTIDLDDIRLRIIMYIDSLAIGEARKS